ncbi:glycosyltransferase family 4 protein [Roseibium polysiphoniae]|uniref:Glycosyltransferase family 4 protein n=1 Tax=Roseibium polysiphoniae TaxID=2571221 RepID=A0ABR9CEW6_9HYPH|nr:glycosyltransferase family 4 protein [Roseibium polysiphoniae]MBD8878431.1 glycosyltransferase family 4 protein [Roseibium polysiphoniae]
MLEPDRQRQLVYFAYPGDLDTPTGGYGYDRRIISGLRDAGWDVELLELGEGFPFPTRETLDQASRRLNSLPEGSRVIVDGLAFGVLAKAVASAADNVELIALVHHPLCKENGIDAATAKALEEGEKTALQFARRVIVTSSATGDQVRDLFEVSEDRLHVVEPGTDRAQENAYRDEGPVCLLSVGTIVQRKGYDLLFEALSDLKAYDWHLGIVGDTSRDKNCFSQLSAQLRELSLSDRVRFHGAVDAAKLSGFYAAADVFVLASRYEGYGMAFTEALSHGLPVLGSGAGAVGETLARDGAIYCGVEDVGQLRGALEKLLKCSNERKKLGMAAWASSKTLPTWDDAAMAFARILELDS